MELQKSPTLNSVITMLEKNKKQAETALNNIVKAIEQGIVNNTTSKRMQELEKLIQEIDKQIFTEKSKSDIIISEETIRQFYKEALLLEPQILIDTLIHHIKCFNDKLEITFNTPIKKSLDTTNLGPFFIFETTMKKQVFNDERFDDITIDFYLYAQDDIYHS